MNIFSLRKKLYNFVFVTAKSPPTSISCMIWWTITIKYHRRRYLRRIRFDFPFLLILYVKVMSRLQVVSQVVSSFFLLYHWIFDQKHRVAHIFSQVSQYPPVLATLSRLSAKFARSIIYVTASTFAKGFSTIFVPARGVCIPLCSPLQGYFTREEGLFRLM